MKINFVSSASKMLIYVCFIFFLEFVIGQKQNFRGGNRYSPVPHYNLGPKPGNGVGVLQDLSNARILSNEPFIISFEFPKLIGSGDSRRNRFGSKRTKSQRKKNRKPRGFRHIAVPEEHVLERRKRLQILRWPPGLKNPKMPNLIADGGRMGKSFMKPEDSNPRERTDYGGVMNFETEKKETEGQPVQVENQAAVEESVHHQNWENIKKKWMSLFPKNKEGENNEVNEESDREEERLKAKSRKMWANCQLLKLLKAPQKNPYFYKLLPPDYPALIMSEEKQLQCNQIYDVIDLAKDKKMIEDKIDQLERILSTGNDTGTRRKREAPADEVKSEGENTLQDESLQGKSEGEVRSDRSKRTKERQHIRKQRSKEGPKKTRRLHRNTKKSSLGKSETQEKMEVENGKRSPRRDVVSEAETKKMLKPEEDETEKKREKQEIKTGKDNSLQDVFSPSEVNKVIRQKEMEANIFDKVLRVMKKFEENNPYDDSFRPQKRESGNSTETVVRKDDSSDDGLELEETIKKLAKIFKILGVKPEANKKKADESEEDSSEESNENEKVKKSAVGKSPKCTCAECPFCQDCYKCFKECRKVVLAAKNLNNQTPADSPQVSLAKDSKSEIDLTEGMEDNPAPLQEERSNNVKLERMYRSKLPPSRDLVRVYFDNPENKLLVWTKRGRRKMPWGPLTSDLQLYRDRARQILKSAEDILHRIRETEDKIHTGQYDGNNQEIHSDKTENVKNMDDIIKKVVNEDDTKNILRTPWEAELEKGVLDGNVVKSNQMSKNLEDETTFNIFKDGNRERTELPKESLVVDHAEVGNKQTHESSESAASYEVGRVEAAEPKPDIRSGTETVKEKEGGTTENPDTELDNKSVEAAVMPIDVETVKSEKINLNDHGEHVEDVEDRSHRKEVQDEEEDVPAKVEAVNDDKSVNVEDPWKPETKYNIDSQAKRKQIIELMKKPLGKSDNLQTVTRESEEDMTISDEAENVEKSNFEEPQSAEEEPDNNTDVKMWHNKKSDMREAKSEESEEVEYQFEGKSAETEKSSSAESEDTENSFSRVSTGKKSHGTESEEVEKALDEESGEKKMHNRESGEVEKSFNDESGDKESYSGESEEVQRSFSKESEADETYSDESESIEKVRGRDSESEEVERSVEKTAEPLIKLKKQGDTKTLPSNKSWQKPADIEKNAENVIEELKKAVMMENEKITKDKEKEKSAEVEKVEKSKSEKEVTGEEIPSYEDAEESERRKTISEEESDEELQDAKEKAPQEEKVNEPKTVEKPHEEKSDFEDHIKSIEESYIIKGVKQTKEEKEAILKALLNVEKKEGVDESVAEEMGVGEALSQVKEGEKEETTAAKNPTKTVESGGDSLKAVIQHLERGQMDENDLIEIKKLDESQMDLLIGEMQKNDEKGTSVNCETRMKLCQALCSCSNNGTDSDLNKYEIIKGFLGWLKDLKMEKMVPISA